MDTIENLFLGPSDEDKKYDLAVFFGRFQPFHEGHAAVVRLALEQAHHVLLLIGSAYMPPSHRNPFSYEQRVKMIFESFRLDPIMNDMDNVLHCKPLEDSPYNDTQWVLDAQRAVDQTLEDIAMLEGSARSSLRVSLIGASEQRSAFYLNRFPAFESIAAPMRAGIASATIRMTYFASLTDFWTPRWLEMVPAAVREFLADFAATPAYRAICDEHDYILNYRQQWSGTPHPVTMVTVDPVVIQSGHVLLVRRRLRPGLGLWALPGGFLPQRLTILDAMVQTLLRETNIRLDADDLKRAVVASRVFDDPRRDPRGRVITHAFHLALPDQRSPAAIRSPRSKTDYTGLSTVSAGQDAEQIMWWPLASVRREMMFADHYDIIRTMAGLT